MAGRSIRRRLTLSTVLASAVAVATALMGVGVFELRMLENHARENLEVSAAVLAENAGPTLLFDDAEAAASVLRAASHRRSVVSVALYDAEGALFARYVRGTRGLPDRLPEDDHADAVDEIHARHPIEVDGKTVGHLVVQARLVLVEQFAERVMLAGVVALAVGAAVSLLIMVPAGRTITEPIAELADVAKRVSAGDFTVRARRRADDETAVLVDAMNRMLDEVKRSRDELEERVEDRTRALEQRGARLAEAVRQLEGQARQRAFLGDVARAVRGALSPAEMARGALEALARSLEADVGAVYLGTPDHLELAGTLAGDGRRAEVVAAGLGLIGRAAATGAPSRHDALPPDYFVVRSGTGAAPTASLVVLPFHQGERLVGVLELGALRPLPDDTVDLLADAAEDLAVAFAGAQARARVAELLEDARRKTEALEGQGAELQAQQEELRASNEELEAQRHTLEAERKRLQKSNAALADAQAELTARADDLERASTYKTEFLANMSHELRTPLNSILVLGRLLQENRQGRLTAQEVEYLGTVVGAGESLLTLINEVLDLSRVEAGRMDLLCDEFALSELAETTKRTLAPLRQSDAVRFDVEVAEDAPALLSTDRQRVDQVLRNLVGNAFKFTTQGRVMVRFGRPPPGARLARDLVRADTLRIEVEDTGIGIPAHRLEDIFEAFRQVDASTQRRHGGTGLGLAIVRELVGLLGGSVALRSEPGVGTCFTVDLPTRIEGAEAAPLTRTRTPPSVAPERPVAVAARSKRLLVIEDDDPFAGVLADIARGRGWTCEVAPDGESGVRAALADPPHGIVLDVGLPGIDGWTVLERLRADPRTAGVPVHVVSASDGARRARELHAVGFLAKPASVTELDRALERIEAAGTPRVLVIDGSGSIELALDDGEDARVETVADAEAALERLAADGYDCVVVHVEATGTPDTALLATLRERAGGVPLLVHLEGEPEPEAVAALEAHADAVVLQSPHAAERLTEEVRLFLYHVESSAEMAPTVSDAGSGELEGRRALVVDDDMRNIFALTAVLEGAGMEVVAAVNGREAVATLDGDDSIDIVLMDMMMPVMDGYEAMRALRADPRHRDLPVFALTAKAMRGDRDRCLEAGADEYLTKPVDSGRLLSTMRAWLGRSTS